MAMWLRSCFPTIWFQIRSHCAATYASIFCSAGLTNYGLVSKFDGLKLYEVHCVSVCEPTELQELVVRKLSTA